jgi:hypothetical protein
MVKHFNKRVSKKKRCKRGGSSQIGKSNSGNSSKSKKPRPIFDPRRHLEEAHALASMRFNLSIQNGKNPPPGKSTLRIGYTAHSAKGTTPLSRKSLAKLNAKKTNIKNIFSPPKPNRPRSNSVNGTK